MASFFVSRVDVLVDKKLDQMIKALDGQSTEALVALKGQAAIANAKLAYARFQRRFGDARYAALAEHGARRQRPLWASTSTKNPAYPDIYYVEALVGPDSVDTMPPATIEAYKDHGHPEVRVNRDLDKATQVIEQLEEFGIHMDEVTHQLASRPAVRSLDRDRQLLISQPGQRLVWRPRVTLLLEELKRIHVHA